MRQEQWQVTVTIDGVPTGVWDKFDGGDTDSSDTKYRPGAMGKERSLGGNQSIDNITVTRLYDIVERDDHTLAKGLLARVGKARVVVARQPLDTNGVPWGAPIIQGGTLKKVNLPKADSSSNTAATWDLEVSADGTTA